MGKEAVYIGNGSLRIEEVPKTSPGKGQVCIAVSYCGICGTDRHIVHGELDNRIKGPVVIGHEMSGVVSDIGDGVSNFCVGDNVTVRPLTWCGKCSTCKRGYTHICENLDFSGVDSDGALQTFWNVKESMLHKIPENVSLLDAALTEPLAVACHDIRRGQVTKEDYIVIIGGGPIGLLIAFVGRSIGSDCLIIEKNEQRRAIAHVLGFTTLNPEENDACSFIRRQKMDSGADVVFEVSASKSGAKLVTELTRPRGRIVCVGIYERYAEINLREVFLKELTILGARVYEKQDFEKALELLSLNTFSTEKIISKVSPIDEISHAFHALDTKPDIMKYVIDCSV